MAKYRRDRLNEELREEAAQILRTVKDPRVSGAFISITGAEVTPDLKYAKIYYSVYNGDRKAIREGLKTANGYIRHQVAERLNLRITPELSFIEDTSIAYGAKIEKIISGFTYTDDRDLDDDRDRNDDRATDSESDTDENTDTDCRMESDGNHHA